MFLRDRESITLHLLADSGLSALRGFIVAGGLCCLRENVQNHLMIHFYQKTPHAD